MMKNDSKHPMCFYEEPTKLKPRCVDHFRVDTPKNDKFSSVYATIPTNISLKLLKFVQFVYLREHDILKHDHWFWATEITPTTFLRILPFAASDVVKEKLEIPRAEQLPMRLSARFRAYVSYKDHPAHIEAIFQDYLKTFLR